MTLITGRRELKFDVNFGWIQTEIGAQIEFVENVTFQQTDHKLDLRSNFPVNLAGIYIQFDFSLSCALMGGDDMKITDLFF